MTTVQKKPSPTLWNLCDRCDSGQCRLEQTDMTTTASHCHSTTDVTPHQ